MNMQSSGNLAPQQHHGGHEMFDAHEVLATFINVLDQYMIFDQFIQDQELKQILNRQYGFMTDLYNICVQTFSTGQDPSHPTQTYHMTQNNQVYYGTQPSQPKKPNQTIHDVSDQGLSAYMLGLIKSTASLLAMTALEMTNPVLRRMLADSVPNFIEMGYEIFLYQNKHHYYQVPQLAQQEMNQMLGSFTQAQANRPVMM
ncbi:spore coat protein [Marinicrinis sediminis]|uniref:Spore coat protein n=1 Tax=Marinicrinis sediminis TaxID=1652465 RepID=A0ABW5REM0_9BACL